MRSRCWPRSTGPVAPEAWRGALPITYHMGPGPAKVHLKLTFNWDPQADLRRDRELPGLAVSRRVGHSRQPSRRLGERRGRSALGLVPELEEARAMGELAKQGGGRSARSSTRVGRRGAGAARIDRMGRDARRRAAAKGRRSTSTPTATAAAIFTFPARTRSRISSVKSKRMWCLGNNHIRAPHCSEIVETEASNVIADNDVGGSGHFRLCSSIIRAVWLTRHTLQQKRLSRGKSS